jgi:hypothetical protein
MADVYIQVAKSPYFFFPQVRLQPVERPSNSMARGSGRKKNHLQHAI